MKKNAKEHTDCNPRTIETICEDHYMDDFIDRFDTAEEAIEVSLQVKNIHKDEESKGLYFKSKCCYLGARWKFISQTEPIPDDTIHKWRNDAND